MINRFLSWLIFSLIGATLGWWLGKGRTAIEVGMASAGFVWLMVDTLHLERVLRWLKAEQYRDNPEQANPAPHVHGLWADLTGKVQRLLHQRTRASQEAQKRLEEFLSALQASPDGVVLLDAQGRIEWCNQTAATHFGVDSQRDTLQYIANLVREPGFNAYLSSGKFDEGVTLTSGPHHLKLQVHLHPYGKSRQLLLSRDITQVELAEGMRRDFVANVSHEIRTPLTVLSGFIETLQTLPFNEQERKHYLGLMSQQSKRMEILVNDLLTLSRLDGSALPDSTEWINMDSLLQQCEQEAQELSKVLTQPTHRLVFEVQPHCEIAGAQSELFSALFNLVGNALRYTPIDGLVNVSWVVHQDGSGEFAVQDQGPGIAPEHLPRLTERFYRIDRSRSRESGGTGLGLAIVKHVVQRHAAQLSISSVLGQGSRFSIAFSPGRVRVI